MNELTIRVPEQVRPGFEKLQHLAEPSFKQMMSVLDQAQPSSDPRLLIDHVVRQIDSSNEKGIEEILDVAITFFSGSSLLGLTHEEFISAIIRGYKGELTKSQLERLRRRIISLMASETLLVASKALDLLIAQPNTLIGARIFTDLRPIFHDDPSISPAGALVFHQLRLTYHGNHGHQDFFVTVNTNDLKILKKAIERAEVKALTLMRVAQTAQLHVVSEGKEQ